MKMKNIFIFIAAFFLLAGNTYAENKPQIFDDIDSDADGCISKDEAKVREDLTKNFHEIDKDKGGTICLEEYTEYENKDQFVPDEVEIPEVGAAPVL